MHYISDSKSFISTAPDLLQANGLNPMLRHLLEVVHECVVDSCLPLSTLQETTTGLYLATFGSDFDFIETSKRGNANHSKYLNSVIEETFCARGR